MIRRNKLRLLVIVLLCGSILDLPSSLAQNEDVTLSGTNAETIQRPDESSSVTDVITSADNKALPGNNVPLETDPVTESSADIETATPPGQDAGPSLKDTPALTNPPAPVELKIEVTEIPTTVNESPVTITQSSPAVVETSPTSGTKPSRPETGIGGAVEGGEITTAGPETTAFIETTAATTTTTTTTTVPMTTEAINTTIPSVPYDVTMKNGIVTIRFNKKLNPRKRRRVFDAIMKRLNKNNEVKEAISRPTRPQETTSVTPSEESPADLEPELRNALRRKRDSNDGDDQPNVLTDDNVKEVIDENDEDTLTVTAIDKNGDVIDSAKIMAALQNLEEDFHEELKDVKVEAMVAGRAADLPPRSLWDVHYGLLITLIVLLSVCLFSIFFCCFCIRCCPNQAPSSEKTPMTMEEARPLHKQPIVMSSPYTDDELVKGESPPIVAISAGPGLQSAPPSTSNNQANPRGSMREKQDPSVTRNGGGQHISKPEDEYEFGIVPLEQLSKSERSQTDVENTKF